jgi:hypothetical protein
MMEDRSTICSQPNLSKSAEAPHNRHRRNCRFSRPDPTPNDVRGQCFQRIRFPGSRGRPINLTDMPGNVRSRKDRESESMLKKNHRTWALAAAAVITLGWSLNQATAGLPDLPPFVPPPVTTVPPPINEPPPPIHSPPPVSKAPEPGTIVLGLIGAGIASLYGRRRKTAA